MYEYVRTMKVDSRANRLRQAALVVLAICTVELVDYWISSYSKVEGEGN